LVIVPVPLGAVKATLTEFVLETVATTLVGTFGFVVAAIDALDDKEVPPELVAVAVNV
jgi:hypothetical protein